MCPEKLESCAATANVVVRYALHSFIHAVSIMHVFKMPRRLGAKNVYSICSGYEYSIYKAECENLQLPTSSNFGATKLK